MNVNADFSQRALVHGNSLPWEDSPMAGVERRRLDRIDTGHDRVTTIVRYAPGSHFSPHIHEGGEEFVVLEGVFEDDYGHWPEGSYIRNPPQSSHTPGSETGCTILVKLWQFAADDRTFIHANRFKLGRVAERGRDGVQVSPVYEDERESVRFEHWQPNTAVDLNCDGGAEVFLLEGSAAEGHDEMVQYSWLRSPLNSRLRFNTGVDGAVVWIKSGHLRFV